ncbi:hypothetical protein Ddc_20731 [Ditylenchus destructor]|nr:hypothetical protein Ddc_20731 [Ditylenchus destructor]
MSQAKRAITQCDPSGAKKVTGARNLEIPETCAPVNFLSHAPIGPCDTSNDSSTSAEQNELSISPIGA